MTELPEDVVRELEEIYGGHSVPDVAVTIVQLSEQIGGSVAMWGRRLKRLVKEGEWARARKIGGQAYWYWQVENEGRDKS